MAHHEPMRKRAGEADEVQTMEKGRAEFLHLGERTVMRATLQPGWRWSADVKPRAGTESCQVTHLQYVVSGRLHVRFDNGEELLLEPGDTAYLPAGHDAWVEGNEPVVLVDMVGGERMAEALRETRQAA